MLNPVYKGDYMLFLVINSLDNDEDRQFITDLYIQYTPWLRSRAFKIVKDLHISEDLAQDCIVNMIRYLDTLKTVPADKHRSYLSTAINNLSKNYLKKASRTVLMNSDEAAELDFIADDYSIEDELDKKYNYEMMRAGFDNLSERDKEILSMRFDMGFNDQQMSELLHIKKNCVRMTVSRSIKRLKHEIKKLEGKL